LPDRPVPIFPDEGSPPIDRGSIEPRGSAGRASHVSAGVSRFLSGNECPRYQAGRARQSRGAAPLPARIGPCTDSVRLSRPQPQQIEGRRSGSLPRCSSLCLQLSPGGCLVCYGASFPFPLAPAGVGQLNGYRPFRRGCGNGSKCPKANRSRFRPRPRCHRRPHPTIVEGEIFCSGADRRPVIVARALGSLPPMGRMRGLVA